MTFENEHETRTFQSKRSAIILVVDDAEIIRSVATEMLTMLGFAVITAEDGVEALEQYRMNKDQIDFVLLDLNMPRMGGEETFRELKKINENVMVIMSSGHSKNEIAEKFAGRGLAGFIQKPYRVSALTEMFESLTDRTFSTC